jgi:16S rRNA C1402 N4-methylase RsmH
VKHFFRDSACFTASDPPWVQASDDEKRSNSRARAAKLRTGVRE